MEREQFTIISLRTKGEKQAGRIQLFKYIVYTRCAQSLHNLYPNIEMMKTNCPKLHSGQRLQLT